MMLITKNPTGIMIRHSGMITETTRLLTVE